MADGLAPVRLWLLSVAALVAAMILVGGATRLTGSGLSITDWQPIMGVVPPFSEAAWQEAFERYRQIPQYKLVNRGMSLEAFQAIYWWEWWHRFLGRLIGAAFLLPFLYFWLAGRLTRPLAGRLLAVFALGALQGGLGWYMVMSGLVDRVDVSPYRLAAHLSLAFVILGAILWVVLDLAPRRPPAQAPPRALVVSAGIVTALIFTQIVVGGFVAGLDAGMGYNTWPLMDGRLVPEGLGAMRPWYLNLFENALAVQFIHRLTAYALLLAAAVHLAMVARQAGGGAWTAGAGLLLAALMAQVALGVWTLLAQVPLGLALAHQGGAIVVAAVAVCHLHALVAGGRRAAAPAAAPSRLLKKSGVGP